MAFNFFLILKYQITLLLNSTKFIEGKITGGNPAWVETVVTNALRYGNPIAGAEILAKTESKKSWFTSLSNLKAA